jgi:hypothetical protein
MQLVSHFHVENSKQEYIHRTFHLSLKQVVIWQQTTEPWAVEAVFSITPSADAQYVAWDCVVFIGYFSAQVNPIFRSVIAERRLKRCCNDSSLVFALASVS